MLIFIKILSQDKKDELASHGPFIVGQEGAISVAEYKQGIT